jgi:DNA polymerase V
MFLWQDADRKPLHQGETVVREGRVELHVTSDSKLEMTWQTTVPHYLCRVSAGFPSPAGDYVESNIDLNEWLIRNKLATYIVRVEGDSMIGEIHPEDRLIVDRSLEPRHRDVVIACIDG